MNAQNRPEQMQAEVSRSLCCQQMKSQGQQDNVHPWMQYCQS
uniref:Uncharacterized protein n=1 Tax=Arundo donax TaxID=35708 RepID=A0A0A8XWU5_ARUDO